MSAQVYHKKSFEEFVKHPRDAEGINRMFKAQESATWPKDYVHVATIDTDNLELVFELTNSIDCAWWTNKGVTPKFAGDGCRSTSVGDIVTIKEEPFQCASMGWERYTACD